MSRRTIAILVGLGLLAVAMVGLAQLTGGNDAKPHPLGTEVVVGHVDPESDGARRTRLALTVLEVREGKPEDLSANGIEVDPEDRTATPYYVEARFENRGPSAVGAHTLGVGIEDSDGNTFGELLVFGLGNEPFRPCPEEPEGLLEPGERVETCTLVLVPEGLDPARIYFLSDNGPDEAPEFVYWATE